MLALLKDLFAHQAWADASLLRSLRDHAPAWDDPEVRAVAHHILAVQRFFVLKARDLPFVPEVEGRVSDSLDELSKAFARTAAENGEWLASLTEEALSRTLQLPRLNIDITTSEALTQAVMHSQGHRAQVLTAIRKHGGKPPVLDYILWTKGRPDPEWL
jgi:uncharacterized damage-inducible protein DinB